VRAKDICSTRRDETRQTQPYFVCETLTGVVRIEQCEIPNPSTSKKPLLPGILFYPNLG
jgi:hypothetical protein